MTPQDLFNELHRRYGIVGRDMVFFTLTMAYEFEPHGRASETWEAIWTLHIPHMAFYMWELGKYRRGAESIKGMTFHGKSEPECFRKAFAFLTVTQQQGLKLEWME